VSRRIKPVRFRLLSNVEDIALIQIEFVMAYSVM
jgi:hypothetical protein